MCHVFIGRYRFTRIAQCGVLDLSYIIWCRSNVPLRLSESNSSAGSGSNGSQRLDQTWAALGSGERRRARAAVVWLLQEAMEREESITRFGVTC